ncbi:YbaB/EbfC family nucleoid-associated protein [Micromonospora sp. LOL_025]|uniref:YbaB/EbfC family nucleoid-associated protein n=1 Tax=Micromonospora sp. LOL_025 TaxID=3345413 RepID=UPI003A839A6F
MTRPRLGPVIDHARLRSELLSLRDRLAEVAETAESDDGLISVTLGAKNELLDLRIDPRVFRDPDSTALADAITRTTHRAAGQVHRRLYALTRWTLADPDPDTSDPWFDPTLAPASRRDERATW